MSVSNPPAPPYRPPAEFRAVASGQWEDPTIWNPIGVPIPFYDRVTIGRGVAVTLDLTAPRNRTFRDHVLDILTQDRHTVTCEPESILEVTE